MSELPEIEVYRLLGASIWKMSEEQLWTHILELENECDIYIGRIQRANKLGQVTVMLDHDYELMRIKEQHTRDLRGWIQDT